jgi:hypothetical protein
MRLGAAAKWRTDATRVTSRRRYPCPCCGHLTIEQPGRDEFCGVCGWQDDPVQLRYPTALGANRVALAQAQENWLQRGRAKLDRPPSRWVQDIEVRIDPLWRPIDLERDEFGDRDRNVWPADRSTLYYWRPDYWRNTRGVAVQDFGPREH